MGHVGQAKNPGVAGGQTPPKKTIDQNWIFATEKRKQWYTYDQFPNGLHHFLNENKLIIYCTHFPHSNILCESSQITSL